MRLIIRLDIRCEQPGSIATCQSLQKEFDTELVPIAGMTIEDEAWEDAREITAVTINPLEEYYAVFVADDSPTNPEECVRLQKMYSGHGWEIAGTSHPRGFRTR